MTFPLLAIGGGKHLYNGRGGANHNGLVQIIEYTQRMTDTPDVANRVELRSCDF